METNLIEKNIFLNAKMKKDFFVGKEYVKDFIIRLLDNQETTDQMKWLKEICEKGGFYVNENININMPIGSLRYYETILFWETENNICMDVVGGKSNSQFLLELLGGECDTRNLNEKIKNLLVEYGVVFNGKSQILKNDVMIYERDIFLKYFKNI